MSLELIRLLSKRVELLTGSFELGLQGVELFWCSSNRLMASLSIMVVPSSNKISSFRYESIELEPDEMGAVEVE